jgi:type II secretory pathway pseudopilin PulG
VRAANAGPIPEDEITQVIRTTAKPPSPVRPGASRRSRSRSRGRRAAGFVAVVLVIGVLAVAAVSYFGRSSATSPTSAAASRQAAIARAAAASWVAQQVSRDVKVSCDTVMCAELRARRFPSDQLLVLGSASQVPTTAAVVVETSAVLKLFGSSLATAFAPAVLASFGSGPSLVTVRAMAPGGAATYQTLLNKDLRQRKTAGSALLGDSLISLPALAQHQLSAGQVDSRLVLALADLASHQPITIVQFGTDGPGASAELPLRFVDLAEDVKAAHLGRAGYVNAVRDFLAQVTVSYRPASMTTVPLPDGNPGLRVTVSAPSPLGVFPVPSGP